MGLVPRMRMHKTVHLWNYPRKVSTYFLRLLLLLLFIWTRGMRLGMVQQQPEAGSTNSTLRIEIAPSLPHLMRHPSLKVISLSAVLQRLRQKSWKPFLPIVRVFTSESSGISFWTVVDPRGFCLMWISWSINQVVIWFILGSGSPRDPCNPE